MTAWVGEYAQATYDFPGEVTTDLPLTIGDVVKITDTVDANWFRGHKVGAQDVTGVFPSAFVERIALPSILMGHKVFVALQNFPAEQSGDLELNKGDIFVGTEPVDESWWRGKNGPLKGIFSLSFVAELEVNDDPRSRSASALSNSLKSRSNSLKSRSNSMASDSISGGVGSGITKLPEMTFARALVGIRPQLDGELAFQMGDLIEITEIIDADWFYGRCHNKEGLVSAVCVEFLDDSVNNSDVIQPVPKGGENNSHPFPPSKPIEDKTAESLKVEDIESRGRNVSSGSYTAENTRSHDAEITPYGRAIYNFTAQVPTELSLSENQIVTLIQHVDEDWTEGEIDGKRGLFPVSFIEIIVDCRYAYNRQVTDSGLQSDSGVSSAIADSNTQSDDTFYHQAGGTEEVLSSQSNSISSRSHSVEKDSASSCHSFETGNITAGIVGASEVSEDHEIGLVLFSFAAEVSGDISVQEGETVEVTKQVDENWLEVQLDNGQRGLVPRNHIEIIGQWPKGRSGSFTGCTASSTSGHHVEMSSQPVQDLRTEPVPVDHDSPIPDAVGAVPGGNTAQATQKCDSDITTHVKTSTASSGGKIAPSSKPNLLAKRKPPVLPKPALGPKPALPLKPSVITTQSFSVTKSVAASSLSMSRTRGQAFNKQRNSISSLDSLIEGEISMAKGDFSQKTDVRSETAVISSALATDTGSQSHVSHMQSKTEFSSSSSVSASPTCTSVSTPTRLTNSLDAFDPLRSGSGLIDTSQPQSSPTFRGVRSKNDMKRNILHSSVSVTEEGGKVHSSASDRRKSASFAEQKMYGTPMLSIKDSAYVNKAFQNEVEEGILIAPSNDKLRAPLRPPTRAPPPRPVSAVTSAAPETVQATLPKIKPPLSPQGPRIALAPSKIPLVPVKVELSPKIVPKRPAPSKVPLVPVKVELPPKIVPKRPAPKAPHIAANNIPVSEPRVASAGVSQQASHPPKHHPSRPTSLPSPPRRPPPRPMDLMSFSPDGPNLAAEEDSNKELVADLKTKLAENQADIKKYEQTRSDLQKSLSQADSHEKEAETKDNLEFVESTLVGLQEEGRRLKENLFMLSPHEARLEKARLLATQHAEEEAKRKEEERKKEIEMKEKKRDQRGKVIDEIIDTEKDYLFSLQLCLETFLDGQPPAGVDLDFLLGNMEEIADVSQKMLVNLETCVSGKSFDEQCVGKCFTFFAEDMKNTYAPYCRNHDEVITAMERYSEDPEIGDYFILKLEKMREQMNAFDVAGVLIKPVQRILKYPLLLNELLKNTEEGHPDKEEIVVAIKAMTDVARAINEYKRRKDLVYKYKKFSDQTFSDKISKLNFHSIKKKSSRIRSRISTNFGITLQMKDENFEREEFRFRNLEKAVKVFLRSVLQYLEQCQEATRCQQVVVDDILQFYKGRECVEATKLHDVTSKILDLSVHMKEMIENTVVVPLNTLVTLFSGPTHVIEKRYDKLLDYNSQLGKLENDKELQAAKNDYEAMNAQLLDELPKFYNLAYNLLRHCIAVFVLARRDFMDQSLRESCVLLGLPSMASKTNMMETFNIRHTTAFDHMSLLSFIPKGFNPRVDTIKADRAKQRGRTAAMAEGGTGALLIASPGSQNESQRMYLRQLYSSSKLYTVTTTYNALDLMDISLTEGTIVGVVKELDPMGNKERWFIDDGVNKGFVPSNILQPLSNSPSGSSTNLAENEDVLSIHSYDSGDTVVLSGNDGRVEFHAGGSSLESSLQQSQEQQQKQQPQYQYYYALYDFKSRHPNEASLTAGHPVTVLAYQDLDGNPEWWLVDAEGNRGYAPANYMTPFPHS